jgi:glucuronoarabinoxylan endo-1,4-beta-xylanase
MPILAATIIIAAGLVFYMYVQNKISKEILEVSIEINGAKRNQKIEGFGGSSAYYEWLLRNLREPYRTEVADLLFSHLGINTYRLRAWTKIESINDDGDPENFNWEAFNFTTDQDQVWNAIEAKKRGVTRFIASVWSPPAWMKNNTQETNDGYLLPEMYEEFAEWISAYIIGYKKYHGIDIGWISIQNEPDYTATWETCIYTPEQLKDLIKVVGRKFAREGITAKIVVPETSGVYGAINYIEAIMSDPEAAQYIDVFAAHLYDVQFFNPDQGIMWLKMLSELCAKYGKPLWMTEYSYLDFPEAGTYNEALYTAQHIHNTLVYGNASVYLVWELFWYRETGLISISMEGDNYKITPKYYAIKQFFKFISPGSIRIDASSDRYQILVSAYLNEESGDITIVIINRGSKDADANIFLKNLTALSFKQYRTSKTEKCEYIGDVAVKDGVLKVLLLSDSITTLATR